MTVFFVCVGTHTSRVCAAHCLVPPLVLISIRRQTHADAPNVGPRLVDVDAPKIAPRQLAVHGDVGRRGEPDFVLTVHERDEARHGVGM